MKKTITGENVHAMSDDNVAKLVNYIDGYIDRFESTPSTNIDVPYILRNIRKQIIN